MAEGKITGPIQERGGLTLKEEDEVLKPPPRRKKSLRKTKMEAAKSRKIPATHFANTENEQLKSSAEEKLVEEGNPSIGVKNNNISADACDGIMAADIPQQRAPKQFEYECENTKSPTENSSNDDASWESKAGGMPGSFSGLKMTVKDDEVSITSKRNSTSDENKFDVEDDVMGNKNGSVRSKTKSNELSDPEQSKFNTNAKSGIKGTLNGNEAARNIDSPVVVVNENFETFCLVEKSNVASNGEIHSKSTTKVDENDTKHGSSKGDISKSSCDSATSGIQSSKINSNLVNSDVSNGNTDCADTSPMCDSHEEFVKDVTVAKEAGCDSTVAEEDELTSQLNNNLTISENPKEKVQCSISLSTHVKCEDTVSSLTVQSPLCVTEITDIKTLDNKCELKQKDCNTFEGPTSDLKLVEQQLEEMSNGMNQENEKLKESKDYSVPYKHLDDSFNPDNECKEFDEDDYSTDTDSDTYYSDFTSSEGEYNIEDAEKLCDVEGIKDVDALPHSKEAETDSINEILSTFHETETVTVTDNNHGNHGDSRHGDEVNTGLELSEDRALSLKRKIGSFKVVESLEPAIDNADVKKASVGMATEVVLTEADSDFDSTKSAEIAILALHKEYKLKHSGRKGREKGNGKSRKFSREKRDEKLEISRPRSMIGEPRFRSRSTGDLDDMAKQKRRLVKKQNSLPVRVKNLKQSKDFKVDFDGRWESSLFGNDSTYPPELIASMGNLEESRERRESGSPLIKQPSIKEESRTQMVTDVGSENDRTPVNTESNTKPLVIEEKDVREVTLVEGKPLDQQEQISSSEDNFTKLIQIDTIPEKESSPLHRPLSTVREESSSSLESATSLSFSSRGSSVSQEHKSETEEASLVEDSDAQMLECQSTPNMDKRVTNLENWKLENAVGNDGLSIKNTGNSETRPEGFDITTPNSRKGVSQQYDVLSKSAPSSMVTTPKAPKGDVDIKKPNSSAIDIVQLRQMKITVAKRKWLSQSAVISSDLPPIETDVKLTNFKKNDEADSPDSGALNQQAISKSPAEENIKERKQVTFDEAEEVTPKRPPRSKKPLTHSASFASPSVSRVDPSRRTPTKRAKNAGRREGTSRWQTLSGAIDADWLSRLTKAPPDLMNREPITLVTDRIPASLLTFPTDKRAQIALELYTTERTYVRGLEIVIELFKNPLEDYLEPKEKTTIFSNIEDIFKVNKDVLFSLCERVNHWKDEQVIGDIFVDNAARFKIYATYCNNYDAAETLIKQKVKKKKEFDDFLEDCYKNDVCQPGLKLPAYLITVVQRIPRYLLLLRDLVKCTPAHHPDARPIKEGLHKMNNIAEYINNQLQAVQGQRAMTELRSRVIGIKAFETPGRSLIKEGEVYIMSTKRTYKCLLFNDMVVFAAKNVNKRSEVELTLELESLWVADMEDNDPQTSKEDAIELYTPERSYTMYTGTRNEKKLWLQKLKTAIAIRLHGEMATESSEIEHRKSNFEFKDGRIYCGIFVDAKRQGHGVLAWQNRTRYVGNFEDDERNGIGELTYSTGEKYNGEWLDDKQHGVGTLTYPNNDVYTGEWKKGEMSGKGLIKFSNDDVLDGEFAENEVCGWARLKCANGLSYEGTWKNSKKHGKGKLIKPNEDIYEGEFSNDRINGMGTMFYASNKATYQGQWENNQRHGTGIYIVPEGNRYEGEWRCDHMSGRGKMWYSNGDTYDGSWYRDMRFGKGIYSCQEGIYNGKFEYNVRHGLGTIRYKDNSEYEGEWQNDQCDGQGKMKYADSSVYEGSWIRNLRNGRGKMTFANGATYEGHWDLGSEHGPDGVFIDEKANYSYEGGWEYGCKHGQGTERTSNGTYVGDFKANMRHGIGVETLKCGIVYEGQWRDNRKVGEVTRKTTWGETVTTEVQYWKEGQLLNKDETIAPDLPFIQRLTNK